MPQYENVPAVRVGTDLSPCSCPSQHDTKVINTYKKKKIIPSLNHRFTPLHSFLFRSRTSLIARFPGYLRGPVATFLLARRIERHFSEQPVVVGNHFNRMKSCQ